MTGALAPPAIPDARVIAGPERWRSELRWEVALAAGRRAVLAQLVPEVAREPSVRRRHVYEAERLATLPAEASARILAHGPRPDPRDPGAAPPWRLQELPGGERLDAWLARAPAPIDEAITVCAALADTLHTIHRAGAVVRDLEPHGAILRPDGAVVLVGVGLARVDILSSRTASSLLLEASPYAAPEHLRRAVVDPRADLYTIGAILWRAVTGELPFGDAPALLAERAPLPPLARIRADAPAGLDELVRHCLAESAEARPESARDVAEALRGGPVPGVRALERVTCQSCGASLRPGLRLCLSCGREAVALRRAEAGDGAGKAIFLQKAREDERFVTALQDVMGTAADAPPRQLNFLVGDPRMYSRTERNQRIQLPAVLFSGLADDSAEALRDELGRRGMEVKVRPTDAGSRLRRKGNWMYVGAAAAVAAGVGAIAIGTPLGLAGLFGGLGLMVAASAMRTHGAHLESPPLAHLRAAPAALPASDPLVAQLADRLSRARTADVKDAVSELALLVQRLCDHLARVGDEPDADLVTDPLEPLVTVATREIDAILTVDDELAELDEGTLVRALAASEARGEPASRRAPILDGLDRLRRLEDRRAAHLGGLLEASSLLRRVVRLGLETGSPEEEARRHIEMAKAALGDPGDDLTS